MRECWLRPNRRVLLVAIALLALLALLASMLAIGQWWPGSWLTLKVMLALVASGLWLRVIMLVNHACLPRLAYQQGDLLVFLRQRRPLRVPVSQVECFFLGQGDSMLAAARESQTAETLTKTRTIVVRLAEAAKDWQARDVRPELGRWCDGYITIRGTWCEPMTPELVKQLNSRLVKIHRQQRQEKATL